jgi:selenocysteine-specific elongation factor
MLAGVGGIDLVLFVVAANEGIKPQTREHFEICRLLAVRRGITVITKSDLVDADTLQVVKMELEEFLRGSFLDSARAPMVAVSSTTGAGMEDLKRELARLASEITPRNSSAHFRLPIDRVFTMKGFGTVITGTLIAGSVAKEDEVEVFPQRRRVRVRGVEVHGSSAERAFAGERTALNLSGTAKEELARGMMLAAAGLFEPTTRADVSMSLLASAKPLRRRAPVHLHAYTAETVAQISLHGTNELKPGASGFAQLHLADPLLLLPGDRFILRQFSPVVTIGGGRVLDAFPIKMKSLASFLGVLDSGSEQEILNLRVARREDQGLSLPQAVRETGWSREQVGQLAGELEKKGSLLRRGEILVNHGVLFGLTTYLLDYVSTFHRAHPLVAGISKQELREQLPPRVPQEIFDLALETLVVEKKLQVAGEIVHTSGRSIVMKDEEAESKTVIEQAFRAAGLKVPALKEVLAGLKIDHARAQRLVTLLLREKALVKLGDDLVFHREALENLRSSIQTYKSKSPKIDVAKFKELTGVSRKYAIPLLEHLDRERITRRDGDERIIL